MRSRRIGLLSSFGAGKRGTSPTRGFFRKYSSIAVRTSRLIGVTVFFNPPGYLEEAWLGVETLEEDFQD